MDENEKYWQQIQQFVKEKFGLPGEVYDIVFLIGVRELGYGFQQLDQETKTKVFNFASIYLMNYMDQEQRKKIQDDVKAMAGEDDDLLEESIYKQAIINYFKDKKIFKT